MAAIKAGENGRVRILDVEMSEDTSWSRSNKTFRVRVRVATANQDHYYSDLRRVYFNQYNDSANAFTGKHPLKDDALGDLEISGSLYADNEAGRLFGEGLLYKDVYRIAVNDAETMAKTLRHIQKYLNEREQEEGYHTSFGQYVARVGNATGCVGARITVPDSLKSTWAHDNYRYCYNVGDVVFEITNLAEKWWAQEHKVKQEEATA